MVKLTAAGKVERGKELTPARLLAFELWKGNPLITAAELDKALKEKGFEVAKTTVATWLTRFKKGKGVRTYDGKPLKGVEPRKPHIPVKPGEITLEQIIKAVGSVEALLPALLPGCHGRAGEARQRLRCPETGVSREG